MPGAKPEETYRKILENVVEEDIISIDGIKFDEYDINKIRGNHKIIVKCNKNLDNCSGFREIAIKNLIRPNNIFYGCIHCTNILSNYDENGNFILSSDENQKKATIVKKTTIYREKMSKIQTTPEVKEKREKTLLKNIGFDNPSKDSNILEKIAVTNLNKYGNKMYLQSDDWKNKIKTRFGVDHIMKMDCFKEKIKNTCQSKYGYNNVMQVMDIWMKKNEKSYTKYEYLFPSGKIVKIQGDEKYAIDKLLNMGYKEDDIFAGNLLKKNIKYNFKQKSCVYFPDIYIKSENKFIEVKSTWTYNPRYNNQPEYSTYLKILAKELGTEESDYNFDIWIFDKNKKLVNREEIDKKIQNQIIDKCTEEELIELINFIQ